jgi:hypothetical protein
MATVTTSKQFRLNLNDWWKGLIMAVLTPVFTIITQSLDAGTLTFNWKSIVIAAMAGMMAYLAKNFFTKPEIVIKNASDETVEAVKSGDAEVKIH